jgi:hypothetical protein
MGPYLQVTQGFQRTGPQAREPARIVPFQELAGNGLGHHFATGFLHCLARSQGKLRVVGSVPGVGQEINAGCRPVLVKPADGIPNPPAYQASQ